MIRKIEPELLYFDVPEVSREEAPIRIPHKITYSICMRQVYIHLLGLAREFHAPRWAVAVEIMDRENVIYPVRRVGDELFGLIDDAKEVGLIFALEKIEDLRRERT